MVMEALRMVVVLKWFRSWLWLLVRMWWWLWTIHRWLIQIWWYKLQKLVAQFLVAVLIVQCMEAQLWLIV